MRIDDNVGYRTEKPAPTLVGFILAHLWGVIHGFIRRRV